MSEQHADASHPRAHVMHVNLGVTRTDGHLGQQQLFHKFYHRKG